MLSTNRRNPGFDVAEVLGDCQGREGDAGARSGGSVIGRKQTGGGGELRILHFVIEVVSSRVLRKRGENGDTAVLHGDVMDHLHHDDGLADAARRTCHLAAAGERNEKVDTLTPVSSTLTEVSCSVKSERTCEWHIGVGADRTEPSTVLPSTFSTRPRTVSPPHHDRLPESFTAIPRTRPSVRSIPTVRTTLSPNAGLLRGRGCLPRS